MYFEIDKINKVNNGINFLSHYYNDFFDFEPIPFAEILKELFTLFQNSVQYRNFNNAEWLILTSEIILYLEYYEKFDEVICLEGTDKEPRNFEKFYTVYSDAYNVCAEIHEYFEKIYPDKFIEQTDEFISGIEYNYTPQQTETKTDKLKAELGEYGFFELPKVKQLSEPNKQSLVELISTNGLPYSIAMFEFLDFLKHLETEHFTTKYKLNKEVAKWFNSDKEGRAVKGNISSLSDYSTENKSKYTAHTHKETVKTDYQKLK